MFQFLTHVELSRSMAAILEMTMICGNQKNFAYYLFTLYNNATCMCLAALLLHVSYLYLLDKHTYWLNPMQYLVVGRSVRGTGVHTLFRPDLPFLFQKELQHYMSNTFVGLLDLRQYR